MLLAGRFPDVAFAGLELTAAGTRAARTFQDRHSRLPEAMAAFAPEPLGDRAAFRRVDFVQGTAAAMPFLDRGFDLVYSTLALEQMESVRHSALAEVARVCRSAYFGIEPFREANASGWRRLYVKQRGYFSGSFDDLRRVGLEPAWATMDFPQEVFLGLCALLAHKRTN